MKRVVIGLTSLGLALALLGAAAPARVAFLREALLPETGRQALLAFGRELGGKTGDVLVDELSAPSPRPVMERQAAEDFPLRQMVAKNLTGFKLPVSAALVSAMEEMPEAVPVSSAAEPVSEAAGTPVSAEDTASAEKVDRFMAQQAAFAGFSLPESVDCSAPALPFETARPVSAEIASVFGYRVHPIYGDVRFHYGTDFRVVDGTEIAAFAGGTVRSAGEISGYGLTVIVDHPEGYSTLYAHCSEVKCAAGDAVLAGQVIALSGHSGQVTGPHMHFELHCGTQYLNPEYYI